MIIAIEGVDGSGKTSLIRVIRESKRFYCHVLASSGPPRDIAQIEDELNWLRNFPHSGLLICDRHRLISEPIYGSILRGSSILASSPHQLQDYVDAVVYCRPPLETIVDNVRITAPRQLGGVWEKLGSLIAAYDEFFDANQGRGLVPVLDYDYTEMRESTVLNWIEGVIK